jgi:hypothetical protein
MDWPMVLSFVILEKNVIAASFINGLLFIFGTQVMR